MNLNRGSVNVEYLVLLALVAMVLLNGNPSPLEQIFDAFREVYARFTHAMSVV
jgi:Flp pilus assembly pilin Flp